MRRVIALITVGILLFTLTGCRKDEPVTHQNDSINLEKDNTIKEASIDNQIEDKNEASEEEIEKIEEEVTEELKEKIKEEKVNEKIQERTSVPQPLQLTQNIKEEDKKEGAEVIAKSDNVVSSKEKEEILNEIDNLLDDVFNSINEMDNLEDEDLKIED